MKKKLAIIVCALITAISAAALSACRTSAQPISDGYVGTYSDVNQTNDTPSTESPSSPTSPSNRASDENVAERINSFSTAMLKNAYEESADGNVLISPLSLYTALALTSNGADGRTLKEMINVLSDYYNYYDGAVCYVEYAPLTCDEMNGFFQRYMAGIASDNESFPLKMANSMWLDNQRVNFEDNFIGIGKYCYNADLFEEEFTPKTMDDINKWAEERTDGQIKELLTDWNDDIISVLVNALTFDAKWETPYESSDVNQRKFTNADNSTTEIDMMSGTENYFFDDGTATGFIKEYEGDRFVYAAIMPNEDIKLEEYMQSDVYKLTTNYIMKNTKSCSLIAGMPKFESEFSFEPIKTLQSLGMKDAFDEDLADLSKLGASKDGNNLFIGDIIHKTNVKFFEEGTEAAAATAIIIEKENAVMMSEESVILDRPYIYFILDKQENIPVFVGTVSNFDNYEI